MESKNVKEGNEDELVPDMAFTPRQEYMHQAAAKACLALRQLIKASLAQSEDSSIKATDVDIMKVSVQWYHCFKLI